MTSGPPNEGMRILDVDGPGRELRAAPERAGEQLSRVLTGHLTPPATWLG
jgi:hypothetical protein